MGWGLSGVFDGDFYRNHDLAFGTVNMCDIDINGIGDNISPQLSLGSVFQVPQLFFVRDKAWPTINSPTWLAFGS